MTDDKTEQSAEVNGKDPKAEQGETQNQGEDAKPDAGQDEAAQDAKDAAGANTADGEAAEEVKEDDAKESKPPAGKKQKRQSASEQQEGSQPKRRRSTRGSKSEASPADSKKIIEFLLSDKPLEMMEKLTLGDKGFRFPRDRSVHVRTFVTVELTAIAD